MKTLVIIFIAFTVLIIAINFEWNNVKYFGCYLDRKNGTDFFCVKKQVDFLGCKWEIPSYVSSNKDGSDFTFSSDFGFHVIRFNKRKLEDDMNNHQLIDEKEFNNGFLKRTYILRHQSRLPMPTVTYFYRKENFGSVSFINLDPTEYIYKCMSSTKEKRERLPQAL